MGIKELEVKGFRSLRHVRWTPGALNVLIGPNGSGKSNLLDVCALLRESAIGRLHEGIASRGGMFPLLWDGQEKHLTFDLAGQANGETLAYHLELLQLGNTSNYSIESERLVDDEKEHIYRTSDSNSVFDPKHGYTPYPDSVSNSQPLLSLLAGPFGNPMARIFQRGLEGWGVYSYFRVDQEAPLRQASVSRSEKKLRPDGQNLTSVLHTLYTGNREFEYSLDAAMSAAFGPEYEKIVFQPDASDQRIQLGLRWRSLKSVQTAASLSDGTLRFLRLIAILANPEPGEVIAIDEPETGLHPGMLPLVAELAAEAAERAQVIFTTHSPQFLDGFDRPPTTTVAELVDGETRLSVLEGDQLARWLEHYSLGSLYISGELEGMA